jgi:hypothetical protein
VSSESVAVVVSGATPPQGGVATRRNPFVTGDRLTGRVLRPPSISVAVTVKLVGEICGRKVLIKKLGPTMHAGNPSSDAPAIPDVVSVAVTKKVGPAGA